MVVSTGRKCPHSLLEVGGHVSGTIGHNSLFLLFVLFCTHEYSGFSLESRVT